MTIGKKLLICNAGTFAMLLSLAGSSWYASHSLGAKLEFATTTMGLRAISAGELYSQITNLRGKQRGMLMYALAHDMKRSDGDRAAGADFYKQAKASVVAIRPLISTEKAKALVAGIDSDLDQYLALFQEAAKLVENGKVLPAIAVYRDRGGEVGNRMESAAADYLGIQKSQMVEGNAEGLEKVSQTRWITGLFLILGLVVVGAIVVVTRGITSSLHAMATRLSEGATQIAAGSGQIASSSQTLAQGASEQAASLEETSASAEEITAMTRQNANNTTEVATLMTAVDQRVADGNTTLAMMIESMQQITASSDKISKIIKVIDEIAFQTNILALNAAVEAARAGEAGMGFAVVADEVRNLAQRSAQAAKDTAALIEESIATSNQGSVRLKKVAEVVGSITEAASKVKILVDEVNIGSQEQAKGIEEIARSLTEMDKVTQGTAAAAEQSASAGQEMSAQAQTMAQIVDQLRVMAG